MAADHARATLQQHRKLRELLAEIEPHALTRTRTHTHAALLGSVTVCSRSGVRLHRCSQINGLVSVTTYVYNLDPPPPEETLLMDPTPLTQVWWLPHKRTRMAFPGAHMSKTPRATTTNAHS